jgi:hypothetical protein
VVGYDGARSVRDEERSVGRKKQVRKAELPSKRRIRWPRWTGFRGKTVWDFLQLLIVPLMLVAIGLVFSLQQDARQQRVEDQRADAERELVEQRAQDEALQAYLDQMSQLMLDRKLLEAEQGTPLYTLAQARTSTLILRLDAEHNESVTRFLINSGLAKSSEDSARLLRKITLSQATLSGADPTNADLSNANLREADLSYAGLAAAHLRKANLREADLREANLISAYLTDADLTDATGVTNEQLEQQVSTLEGATMPNGQKYEDWLKTKNREEGGKNDGSS